MANLVININSGGLSRQSANTDTWGGLFVEVDALPGSWTANEVKNITKPEDLATYGITEDAVNNYYKLVYWHVSEVFRLNPNATLYVQLALDATASYSEILTAFHNYEDSIRLFGIVKVTETLDATETGLLDTALDTLFSTSIQPARAILTLKKDVADALPDFSASTTNQRVMVDVANDLTTDGLAKTIFDSALGMCGAAGTFLGQLLGLGVHQKPSWREKPVNGGGRWAELGDINGDSVEDLTTTEITAYATAGLNLVVRTIRLSDAFISNARMAIITTDDFAIVTHGRVIDKAAALVYDALVTELDGPIYIDPTTGKIAPESIQRLTRKAYDAINNNMVIGKTGNNVEVSVDVSTGSLPLSAIYIDPDQDLLTSENLTVQIRIVPVGSASTITVDIGLVASLA